MDSVRERPDLFPSRERSDKVLPRLLTVAPCSTLRAAKDVLLRQLFSGIVVDCTGETRALTLHWKQRGESTLVSGMPPE